MVELTGRRLCGEQARCETAAGVIQIGVTSQVVLATILEYADDRALIEIPGVAPTGPTQLVVTVNERSSNALAFEVLP